MKKAIKIFGLILILALAHSALAAQLSNQELTVKLDDNMRVKSICGKDKKNLIKTFGFSWYSRGNWRNEKEAQETTAVVKKSADMIQLQGGCRDFTISQTITLLPKPAALKIDYKLTAKYDFLVGGGEVPGGIGLPRIVAASHLTHWLQADSSGGFKIMLPQKRSSQMGSSYIAGLCTPDGKSGYFLLADNRIFAHLDQSPFIVSTGLSFSNEAFRFLRKGESLSGQIYMIPFSGNPEEVAAAAIKAYCSPNPAERAVVSKRYENYEAQAPSSYLNLADNADLTICGGDSEFVLPQQKLPSKNGKALTLSAARNENTFAGIVIRPKKALDMVNVTVSAPPEIKVTVSKIEMEESIYAPHHYGIKGAIPDMLLPVKPCNLTAEINYQYLLSFKNRKGIKPGVYNGTVKITSGGKILAAVPYELKVRSFALPVTPAYKTAFLVWSKAYFSKGFDRDMYCADQRELRITVPLELYARADESGNIPEKNIKSLQRKVKKALAAGDTCYRLTGFYEWRSMPLKDKNSPEAKKWIQNYTRQIAQALREINALDRAFVLVRDETHRGDKKNQEHIRWIKWIKEAAPDMPVITTMNHPVFPLAEVADRICGSSTSNEVVHGKFGDKKEYWLYENGLVFTIGAPGIIPRSIPWRSIPAKWVGYHQWNTTSWYKGKIGEILHGTGTLYYPPRNPGEKPIRSLRLVNFAQGVSDYDYIQLLRQEIDKAQKSADPKKAEISRLAQTALDKMIQEIVPGKYDFRADFAKLRQARSELADWIEKLQNR